MKQYLVASRYASGLSAALSDDHEAEAAARSLSELGGMYAASPDLRSILENPAVSFEKRQAVLEGVLDASEAHPAVRRLAEMLLRRGRVALLEDVAEVVSDRVDERMNRTAAQVTSAQPMPDDQRARVEESLAQFSGKTVRATYETDPALIGGLTAVIGGRVIDGSLRTRLARIKEALIGQEIEVE